MRGTLGSRFCLFLYRYYSQVLSRLNHSIVSGFVVSTGIVLLRISLTSIILVQRLSNVNLSLIIGNRESEMENSKRKINVPWVIISPNQDLVIHQHTHMKSNVFSSCSNPFYYLLISCIDNTIKSKDKRNSLPTHTFV